MRKAWALFLSFLFFFASTGYSMNDHYCCGRHVKMSFSLWENEYFLCAQSDYQCCVNSEKPGDCCKQKSAFFQVDDDFDFQDTESSIPSLFQFRSLLRFPIDFQLFPLPTEELASINVHDPPSIVGSGRQTIILNQVFRI